MSVFQGANTSCLNSLNWEAYITNVCAGLFNFVNMFELIISAKRQTVTLQKINKS